MLGAQITVETIGFSGLEPMVAATLRELDQTGMSTPTTAARA